MKSVGIIGSGRWGRNIARSFAKKRNVSRVVSSGNTDNLEKMKTIVPNIIVSSIDDLLEDEEIDSVVVAVPIENLSGVATKCLLKNKHVFLEKPAATSSDEIEKIEAVRGDRVCLVNYLYLVDPSYLSFKNAVQSVKIDEAVFVWRKWGSFNNDILLNLASHELSMLVDTLEEVVIEGNESKLTDDSCIIDFRTGPTRAIIDIDRKSRTSHKSVMYKTSSGLFMWTPGFFAHADVEVISNEADNLLDLQRDRFLSLVSQNQSYTNLGLSKKILELIEGIKQ